MVHAVRERKSASHQQVSVKHKSKKPTSPCWLYDQMHFVKATVPTSARNVIVSAIIKDIEGGI